MLDLDKDYEKLQVTKTHGSNFNRKHTLLVHTKIISLQTKFDRTIFFSSLFLIDWDLNKEKSLQLYSIMYFVHDLFLS